DFVLVDFNDTAEDVSGGMVVGLVGKTAKELNGHIPEILDDFAECFSKRSSKKRELYCRLNNLGNAKYLAINSSFVLPNLILVQTEDITERKQTDEAILRAKKEWERALDSVPDLISIIDNQHRFVRVNKAMADRLGMNPAECVGQACYAVVHGLDKPPSFCPHMKSLKDSRRHTADFFEEHLSGAFVVTTSPLLSSDGQMVGSMHIAHDNDQLNQSDEKIMQLSKELATLDAIAEVTGQSFDLDEILNSALEQVADVVGVKVAGVYLVDKDMENLNVKVVKGVSDSTAKVISPIKIGKGVSGCVVQSGEPVFIESLPDSVDLIGKRALRMVIQEQLKAAVCIPLKAKGRILGVMYAMTDNERTLEREEREFLITISRQISGAIDAAEMHKEISSARESDELDRLRMAFLASISHEIRTPLASIKGFAS
ncbi:MAG: GAF domain-containing protein, partial [Planctomycetes bacterium]|nr:GAF domain-containing protein [Planctomycetota bacterium]